tara:strand:- start:118 stop:309 length:192 start_codon:yes stop_codon:yes gene_type:complete
MNNKEYVQAVNIVAHETKIIRECVDKIENMTRASSIAVYQQIIDKSRERVQYFEDMMHDYESY